jgi:hypothetical protein
LATPIGQIGNNKIAGIEPGQQSRNTRSNAMSLKIVRKDDDKARGVLVKPGDLIEWHGEIYMVTDDCFETGSNRSCVCLSDGSINEFLDVNETVSTILLIEDGVRKVTGTLTINE